MTNFNILFSFQGIERIAMVYKTEKSSYPRYSVYFTDVEMVLHFGAKIDYLEDGSIFSSKEINPKHAEELHHTLQPKLRAA